MHGLAQSVVSTNQHHPEVQLNKAKIPLFRIDTINPVDQQIKEILTGKSGTKK